MSRELRDNERLASCILELRREAMRNFERCIRTERN